MSTHRLKSKCPCKKLGHTADNSGEKSGSGEGNLPVWLKKARERDGKVKKPEKCHSLKDSNFGSESAAIALSFPVDHQIFVWVGTRTIHLVLTQGTK